MKKVAIIGGGGAGLCAAKHLLSHAGVIPTVFEQSDNVGGTWVYQDLVEGEEPFSSLYKSLRTNLPKEVMMYPGFPYPNHLPSFICHTEVRSYLERYARHYGLHDHIRLRTRVEHVTCTSSDGWKVTTVDGNSKEKHDVFDSILVCNGHYSIPHYPDIPGIQNFRNRHLHSHYYRSPDQFSGALRAALILGAGPSAFDISIELAKKFSKVYLSHWSEQRFETELPKNVHEVATISHVADNGDLVCADGFVCRDVDLFLPSTGYEFSFPFLDGGYFKSLTTCENRVVSNLYKHMFYIQHPTVCFIGVPLTVSPLPFMHQQCAYAASILSGKKHLPTESEMFADTRREELQRAAQGGRERHFHKFGVRQFEYLDELARLSGEPPNPAYMKDLYAYVMTRRRFDIMNFRKEKFEIVDDNTFNIVNSST